MCSTKADYENTIHTLTHCATLCYNTANQKGVYMKTQDTSFITKSETFRARKTPKSIIDFITVAAYLKSLSPIDNITEADVIRYCLKKTADEIRVGEK